MVLRSSPPLAAVAAPGFSGTKRGGGISYAPIRICAITSPFEPAVALAVLSLHLMVRFVASALTKYGGMAHTKSVTVGVVKVSWTLRAVGV